MSNDEFREGQQEARDHGLKARHETREARAVRREIGEEIALAIEAYKNSPTRRDDLIIQAVANECASIAREIGSRDPQ